MRGGHFDAQYQQRAAQARTQMPGFREHNQHIGRDSAARQRVQLRLTKGSPLLLASDVHQVCLGDIRGHLGAELSEEQRRVILARLVWAYIWEGLSSKPKLSPKDVLALAARAREYVGQGLPLPHPLLVVGVAPEDFCRRGGTPLPRGRPKKLFRAALFEARKYAEMLQAVNDYFKAIQYGPVPSTPMRGRRRRMESLPQFQHALFCKRYQIVCGQSRRPFILPETNDLHPTYWLQYAPDGNDEEAELQVPKLSDWSKQGGE